MKGADLLRAKNFVHTVIIQTHKNGPVLTIYTQLDSKNLSELSDKLSKIVPVPKAQKVYEAAQKWATEVKRDKKSFAVSIFHNSLRETHKNILIFPIEHANNYTEFFIDSYPYFERLLELINRDQPYMVIIIEKDYGSVQIWSYKQLVEMKKIHSYVEGKHKKGGMSQARFQRGAAQQAHQHYRDVVEDVEEMWAQFHPQSIILAGPGHAKQGFEKLLTQKLQSKVIGHVATQRELDSKTIDKIYEEKIKGQEQKEHWVIQKLIDKALTHGTAALGLNSVEKAAELGEINTLYLDEHFPHDHKQVELIIDVVEGYGGTIQFLQSNQILHSYEGIAADLRYI